MKTAPETAARLDILRLFSSHRVRIRCVNLGWIGREAVLRSSSTHIIYPYGRVFILRMGSSDIIAEPNQAILLNARQTLRIQHIGEGTASSLVLTPSRATIEAIATTSKIAVSPSRFLIPRTTVDQRSQLLAAVLRRSLAAGTAAPHEAETLALALIQRTLGDRTSTVPGGTYGLTKLVDRAKLVLQSNPLRRWTLTEVAKKLGVSPAYLTQGFYKVEGVPLYRYHLRLRISQALDRVRDGTDLTQLALDLGFSNHSHFSAAFRQAYGRSPSAFREMVRSSEPANR